MGGIGPSSHFHNSVRGCSQVVKNLRHVLTSWTVDYSYFTYFLGRRGSWTTRTSSGPPTLGCNLYRSKSKYHKLIYLLLFNSYEGIGVMRPGTGQYFDWLAQKERILTVLIKSRLIGGPVWLPFKEASTQNRFPITIRSRLLAVLDFWSYHDDIFLSNRKGPPRVKHGIHALGIVGGTSSLGLSWTSHSEIKTYSVSVSIRRVQMCGWGL